MPRRAASMRSTSSPRDAAARLAESMHEGERAIVTYAVAVSDAEQFLELREKLAQDGYRRLVVGGVVREIDEVRPSEATSPGVRVEVVVDRVTVRKSEARRLQEAIEAAWSQAELRVDEGKPSCASTEATRGTDQPSHVSVRARARVPEVRALVRAAAPRALLLQLADRRVRGVPRVRPHHRDRLAQGLSRSQKDAQGRRHQAVERSEHHVGARHPREVLRRAKDPARRAVGEAHRRAARAGARRRGLVAQGQVPGRPRLVQVARDAHLQDARPRAALALPRVHALHVVRRVAPERDRPRVPRRRLERRRLARAHGRRSARAPPRLPCPRSAGQAGEGAARVAARVPRRGRHRLPHARPPGANAERRRSAARRADDGPRCGAHGDALRARRADRGPPRDRRPGARARDGRPREGRQHRARRRARAGHHPGVRSGARDGAGRRSRRRAHPVRRNAGRAREAPRPAHGQSVGDAALHGARTTAGPRVARSARRAGAQPPRRRRSLPARRPLRGHGAERLGQVDARARGALSRRGARARRLRVSTSPAPSTRSRGWGT